MTPNNEHKKFLYTIKIELVGSEPLIWRRILIPSDTTFFALHIAIQDSFGWTDSHLHQFHTKTPYGRDRDYIIISFPYPDPEFNDEVKPRDERSERVSQWLKKVKDGVYYEYDFGDGWIHKITLEQIEDYKTGKYPKLIDGKNACPPEDCGGLGGYGHLLEVLSNPKHDEYEDMLEWLDMEPEERLDPTKYIPVRIRFSDAKKELKRYEKGFNS